MKSKLKEILNETYQRCYRSGLFNNAAMTDYVVEVPNNPDHGHFATNLPLTLASVQKMDPRQVARIILDSLADEDGVIEKADIAGPGFINFRIRPGQWFMVLGNILELRHNFGRNTCGAGERVLVEFVSANPTGPLHLGHGRGAALGDTLCRILAFSGYEVTREFYINDAGVQIRLLGESIFGRWKQLEDASYPFPENGYHGEYVVDLAKTISEETDLHGMSREEAIQYLSRKGEACMLDEIRADLSRFRVEFDIWYSERELSSSGIFQRTLQILQQKAQLYEGDDALWIKTTAFGDDKDRVIRKRDGQFTYFASDISYHMEKRSRGFSRAINIWGADHHGYVPRIKAALKACDGDENWLSVILIQLVKLWQGGQEIKMSKRTGQYVALRELLDEVGVDAARFVFLTKSNDSTLDFDIDVVKKQDSDNPVYYVQYAHARICSMLRKANGQGIALPTPAEYCFERLVLDEELALMRIMEGFPGLLEDICRTLEPHRLTYYLTELASQFHRYFNLGTKNPECRVITSDPVLTQARLCLVEAVRTVIANGLGLLGIDSPEKM
jgi:arginyl-tRNA synthetase